MIYTNKELYITHVFKCFIHIHHYFCRYIAYLFHKNPERAVITIAEKLAEINIVYVKFVQAISASTGIIDDQAKQRLAQYADNVPYKKEDLDFTFLGNCKSGIYLKSINRLMRD